MTEIVIDVTRLLSRGMQGRLPTGVDRVSLEYVRHFREKARALVRFAGRWITLERDVSHQIFGALLGPDEELKLLVRVCVGKAYLLGWSQAGRHLLLNTGHSGLEQPGYAEQLRRRCAQSIFFLHDLIPITHPEYCRAGEGDKHLQRLSTMLTLGRGIVVNSRETQNVLEDFSKRMARVLPPCVVAPLAPCAIPRSVPKRPMLQPYFVMLGTIEPRKNHLMLLQIWRQLVDDLGEAAPRLVIIGHRGWDCEQVVDLLERCAALRSHVIELNECKDADLTNWLSFSQALLFPSFAEGFGMPIVEALALGVPVIASDLRVFREVAQNVPDYLNPLDGLAWRTYILDYSQPKGPLREAQFVRLQGFVAPSWSQHFDKVDAFLRQVMPEILFP